MVVYKGWTLTTEGNHYFARQGNLSRRFATRGAREAWINQQP